MGIEESLALLKQAQERDREIYRIRRELVSIPDTLREFTSHYEGEKVRLTRLEGELKGVQLRQKQKEGELAGKESLIVKYDSQLMQVKTNKEYAVLQQQIADLKADRSLLEDEILGILDEVDRVQREVRAEKERLIQVERELEEKKKELARREEELAAELGRFEGKRAEIIIQVPPEARKLYDKIIEKKEGLALVPVDGEACGACRMEIRPQLLNELKLKEMLVICESCSRILYID